MLMWYVWEVCFSGLVRRSTLEDATVQGLLINIVLTIPKVVFSINDNGT